MVDHSQSLVELPTQPVPAQIGSVYSSRKLCWTFAIQAVVFVAMGDDKLDSTKDGMGCLRGGRLGWTLKPEVS